MGSNHGAACLTFESWIAQAVPLPRTLRVEFPGAMYYVMTRGNCRQDIYLDDVDPQDFLKTGGQRQRLPAHRVRLCAFEPGARGSHQA
jgi:hypothetical protein